MLKVWYSVFLPLVVFFISCENAFEYSPYDAVVKDSYKNTTDKNIELIKRIKLESDTFSFAVVTDNHYHYDNLRSVIDDVNSKDKLLFTLFAGDLTDLGLSKEYEIFHDIASTLKVPYLTVIGNHDYLSNGDVVYEKMFGSLNYSFEFNNNKFVFFDNIVWESNKTPDFNWLENQLTENEVYKKVFVVAHIPPYTNQFTKDMESTYTSIMSENNVNMSIHGHIHAFKYSKAYQDNVNYLTVPWLKKPEYCIVNVQGESIEVEYIKL